MEFQAHTLHRVLACNGSVDMGESPLPMSPQTDEAIEGIAAHYVASQVLSGKFSDPLEFVERQTPSGFYVTPEMAEFVAVFVDTVALRGVIGPLDKFGVETTTDFTVCDDVIIRGRTDHWQWIEATRTLYVDDFKYGFHSVNPETYSALPAYALGLCIREGFEPLRIVLTIHQPRPFHRDGPTRSVELTGAELDAVRTDWAQRLPRLDGILRSGELQCYRCPALAICPAARAAAMNGIDATDHAYADDIPDAALAFELDMLERAKSAIETRYNAANELATHRVKSGKIIPGRILENAQGNRKWLATTTPELLKLMTGKDLAKPKMPTLAEAKAAGLKDDTITGLTERPNLGARLVRYDASKHGKKMFGIPNANTDTK